MPVSTTDVVTNVVSGVDVPKNATTVVYCQRTGGYESSSGIYETSIGYNDLANKYTNRFDDVNYYTIGNTNIVGG